MSTRGAASRALNVVLRPGSEAHRHAPRPAHGHGGGGHTPSPDLAAGFHPRPSWNLVNHGGPTIADLTFINCYVGPAGSWSTSDMQNIDRALSAAMSDANLQSVIAQYYKHEISSTMLPSVVHETHLPATVFKDFAEQLVRQLHDQGVLGQADATQAMINVMLPRGIVLSDDFSPGHQPAAGEEEEHERRKGQVIKIDPDDAASSKEGLGGYHGSIHPSHGTSCYYAVGVYSEGDNGIPAFGEPWKNVVATFYHELVEARSDAAVEDVNATGDGSLLGWYSETGQGEIGDLPINAADDISLVFKEVQLADGSGTVPVQLMWSNAASGPAAVAHVHAGQGVA
jgi:hypothetical protein